MANIALMSNPVIPELESECLDCQGTGNNYVSADDEFAICSHCNGSGLIPTPIGLRILELVRHNSRMSVNAELLVSGAAVASYPR